MEDEGKEPDKVLWESGSSQPCEMANMPGFRFQPTEEELVGFYLRSMVVGHRQEVELINVLDLYRYDPWELPAMAFMQGEREWLFFCPRDKKYPNGVRPNRVTASGYWKATGTDRPVRRSKDSRCIGLKKTLVFYTGKAPKGCKTEWIMNEYRLPQNDQSSICSLPNLRKPSCSKVQKEVALCRIYKKSGHSNILPTTTTMTSDPDYCVPLDDHCTSPSTVPTLHHRKTSCSSSSNELEGSLHSSTTDALLRRVLRDQLSACMAARSDHMTMQAAVSATCCNDPFSPNSKHSVLEDMEEILEFGTRKLDDCTNSIHYHPAHQQALGNIAAGHPHPNYRNSLSPPNRLSDPIICNNRSSMVKLETGDLSSMLYSVNPAKELTADSIISTTVPVSPFTNYTVPDHGEAVIASLDQSFVIKSSAHVDVSSCVSASQMNNSLQGIEIAIPDQAQVSWFRPEHVQYPQGHGSIFGDSSSLQPATCLHPSSASLVTLSSIDRLLKASMWSHI